jgi:3-hydroxyisobutyrate dehydrogenase-like beta-hydroxyacid dehydrogenase
MAARFLAAGYPIYGDDQTRGHAQRLMEEGLRWCDPPRQGAEAADIVFTSLPDDGVSEAVASGPDGILAGLDPRRSVPARSRSWSVGRGDLLARGTGAARTGTPTRIGDNGQGLVLKLAINISLAVQMLAFCEGLLLAQRDGIDLGWPRR